MAQLVQGLARLHPAWRMDGDKFADRDRHHSAVRRRLRALEAMGLLRWRVGIDVDGEDARTELELLDAPPACYNKFGTPLCGSSYVGEQQPRRQSIRPAATKRLRRQNGRDARERNLKYRRRRRV